MQRMDEHRRRTGRRPATNRLAGFGDAAEPAQAEGTTLLIAGMPAPVSTALPSEGVSAPGVIGAIVDFLAAHAVADRERADAERLPASVGFKEKEKA